ncbi:hypothetical protein ACHAW5_011345 [Stephanodiscus triporus]|uniref:Uncharacterized protein n=1 Tax=Stephanodiscus triporus TaxID=2934178 RepID=A0ABD3QX25_9STRA
MDGNMWCISYETSIACKKCALATRGIKYVSPSAVTSAVQSISRTIVLIDWNTMAGPSILWPGFKSSKL